MRRRSVMIRTYARELVRRSLMPLRMLLAATAVLVLVPLAAAPAAASGSSTGFGFGRSDIAGFPLGGEIVVTGGGAFDLSALSVHGGGGFSCTQPVGQGFLAGCLTGEGVRWDTDQLLTSTSFKCTGSASEALKPISTNDDTAVFQADFYRAGDANDESFSAQMIVSAHDIADDIQGIQNVWVQSVGCGTASARFGA
jgi:hypothetical protein